MFLDEECTKEVSSYDDLIIPLLPHTLIKEERIERYKKLQREKNQNA